jgi:hypothetical protein
MSRSHARFALAKRRRYGSGHSPAREIVEPCVPEQVSDLAERGASMQHLCRQSVAELVRSRRGRTDPGTLDCVTNNRPDGTL